MPPLEWKTIQTVFANGLNEGTDPKLVQQDLLRAENIYRKRQGILSKRHGQVKLENSVGAGSTAMGVYRDRACVYGEYFARHNGQTDVPGRFDVISSPPLGLLDVGAEAIDSSSGDAQTCPDMAELGNVRATVALVVPVGGGNYELRCQTFDRYSGIRLASSTVATSANVGNAKLLAHGTYLLLFYATNADALVYRSINTTTGAIGAEVTMAAAGVVRTAYKGIDACVVGTNAVVVYIDSSSDCGICRLNSSLALITTTAAAANARSVGVCAMNATTAVVSWADQAGPDVSSQGFDMSLGSLFGPTQTFTFGAGQAVENIVGAPMSSAQVRLWATVNDPGSYGLPYIVKTNTIDDSGTAGTQATRWYGGFIAGKPVVTTTQRLVLPLYTQGNGSGTLQRLLVWVDDAGYVLGKTLLDFAANPNGGAHSHAAEAWWADASTWCMAAVKVAGASNQITGTGLVKLTATRALDTACAVESVSALLMPGALGWQFDGSRCYEQGFLLYPEGLGVTVTAGGSMGDGVSSFTYSYLAVYAHTDAEGNRHRSAPSPATTCTITAANRSTSVTVPNLLYTMRAGVVIELYRTEANGSAYFKIAEKANATTGWTTTFTDTAADSAIRSNEQVYTLSSPPTALENIQPPPFRVHALYQQRHFVVDRERESHRIRYSQQFVRGEGLEHSDVLTVEVNADGGRITALAEVTDKLVIFKADCTYATQGQGRNTLGQGQGYMPPFLLSPSVGCITPRSIAIIPDGLVFQARGGMMLLDHSLAMHPIGDAVRYQTQEAGLTITGAVVLPELHAVVWTTDTGPALVYSYKYKQWFTWTNYEATHAVAANGVLYRHRAADARVWREDRAVYGDNGSYVPMVVETGWLSPAGLLAFQRVARVLLLGQGISAHTLRVSVAYDFDPTWYATRALDIDETIGRYFDATAYYQAALGTDYIGKAYVIDVRLPRQKCTAIRFRIEDTAAAVGEGYSLTGIALTVGARAGRLPVPRERATATGAASGSGSAGSGGAGGSGAGTP